MRVSDNMEWKVSFCLLIMERKCATELTNSGCERKIKELWAMNKQIAR